MISPEGCVIRKLKSEHIEFNDDKAAITTLSRCVLSKLLIKTYKNMRIKYEIISAGT